MELPVLKPDFNQPSSGSMKVTWLGHATVMVQTEQCTVLTDPAFSPRCSPVFFYGPQRYRPPPCKIDEFPKVSIL